MSASSGQQALAVEPRASQDLTEGETEFFRSGDIGWLEEESFLCCRGRRKGTVKTGGENVSMQEVEPLL
ncbi:hypothetical protein [Amycolatopsis benzoatilytica]|uniref:hypothetical protein n=1 Tax=Amycolatopsis benzoatilytica TaxID=346045 RepID=UPI000367DAB2|nr:hypothetical protein [Amycolatopsis benzoatilytica]